MTDEDKTTLSRPVEPVAVTVIATGDSSKLPSGTEATTPGAHQPNIVVQVVAPFVAILIRAINLFCVTTLGLVTGGMTPAGSKMLGAPDFYHLLLISAGFAVAPVSLGLLKDFVTVFGKLEQKYPLITGSI